MAGSTAARLDFLSKEASFRLDLNTAEGLNLVPLDVITLPIQVTLENNGKIPINSSRGAATIRIVRVSDNAIFSSPARRKRLKVPTPTPLM